MTCIFSLSGFFSRIFVVGNFTKYVITYVAASVLKIDDFGLHLILRHMWNIETKK